MAKQTLTVVVGTVGVGKSTYTCRLADDQKAREIKMDELFKVNPFFDLTVKNRKRWSFASDLWFLKKRSDYYFQIPMLLEEVPVVVDSGLPMSLAYAESRLPMGYYSQEEHDLYFNLAETFLEDEVIPDHIIFLKAPIREIEKRIKKRGRPFEIAYFTSSYIHQIDDAIDRVLVRYMKLGSKVQQVWL